MILGNYFIQQRFKRDMVDNSVYIKIESNYQLVIFIYVDDIIFGGCKYEICKEFLNMMQNKFEISMVSKLA